MKETKQGTLAALLKIASNPVVQYAAGGVILFILIRYGLPNLFSSAKKSFNDQVDETFSAVSTIVGSPASQVPAQRTTFDSVRGIFTQGDRALSDLFG